MGILIPEAYSEYTYYVDKDFFAYGIFLFWNTYIYTIKLQWSDIKVDKSSGGGGGIISPYNLGIMSETPESIQVNGWKLYSRGDVDFQLIVNLTNPTSIKEFWANISYSLNGGEEKSILVLLNLLKIVNNGDRQFELWGCNFSVDKPESTDEYTIDLKISILVKINEQYVIIDSMMFNIGKKIQTMRQLSFGPLIYLLFIILVGIAGSYVFFIKFKGKWTIYDG